MSLPPIFFFITSVFRFFFFDGRQMPHNICCTTAHAAQGGGFSIVCIARAQPPELHRAPRRPDPRPTAHASCGSLFSNLLPIFFPRNGPARLEQKIILLETSKRKTKRRKFSPFPAAAPLLFRCPLTNQSNTIVLPSLFVDWGGPYKNSPYGVNRVLTKASLFRFFLVRSAATRSPTPECAFSFPVSTRETGQNNRGLITCFCPNNKTHSTSLRKRRRMQGFASPPLLIGPGHLCRFCPPFIQDPPLSGEIRSRAWGRGNLGSPPWRDNAQPIPYRSFSPTPPPPSSNRRGKRAPIPRSCPPPHLVSVLFSERNPSFERSHRQTGPGIRGAEQSLLPGHKKRMQRRCFGLFCFQNPFERPPGCEGGNIILL